MNKKESAKNMYFPLDLKDDEILHCSGGRSYFQINPEGYMYRCLRHMFGYMEKESICNIRDKIDRDFLNMNDSRCFEKECSCQCDRDWSIKWIEWFEKKDKEINVIPKIKYRKIERTMYDERFGDVNFENINDLKKVFIYWSPTFSCNYSCSYCSCCFKKEPDALSDREWILGFEKIMEIYEGGSIATNGGEPFLREELLISVIKTIEKKFSFTLVTNLSHNIVNFVRSISPVNKDIIASLHPTCKMFNFDIFLGRILLLKESGFSVMVNFINYPEQLFLFDRYKDIFDQYDIPFCLAKWDGYIRNSGMINSTENENSYSEQRFKK